MRKLLIFTFATWMVLLTWFTTVHAAPGFWPLPSVQAPPNLPARSAVSLFLYSPKALKDLPIAYAQIIRAQAIASLSQSDRLARNLEFDHPRPDGDITLARYIHHGTGVVLGNRHTIVTSALFFRDYGGDEFKLMILDHRGRLLLDTRFTPGLVRHTHLAALAIQRNHPVATLPYADLEIAADVMILSLHEDLPIEPVRRLAKSPGPGDEVFLMGYPDRTLDRHELFGVPDSDHLQLRLSTGQIVPISSHYDDLLKKLIPNDEQRQLFKKAKIFADPDSAPGSVGSPLFDQHGRMIGIMGTRSRRDSTSLFDYVPEGGHGVSAELLFDVAPISGCELDLT